MEDTLPAQNAPAVEDNSVAAPPAAEPTTSVEPTQEPAVAQEPSSEVTTPPVEPVASPEPEPVQPERQPRPAERRIQELVQQNKQLKEQLVTAPVPQISPQPPKLSELIQGRESLDPAELDQLGQQVYAQGAQVARSTNGLEVAQLRQEMVIRDAINETDKTAAQLPNEYKELNPNDTGFNPALEAKIVSRYQKEAVRNGTFDPSVKLADIAKEEVEFYREATEYGKAQTSAALATQADQAAVTPTNATPTPDKTFEQMSLPEQEAYLRAQGHDI